VSQKISGKVFFLIFFVLAVMLIVHTETCGLVD